MKFMIELSATPMLASCKAIDMSPVKSSKEGPAIWNSTLLCYKPYNALEKKPVKFWIIWDTVDTYVIVLF